jgi:hypothetical protein
MGAKSTVRKPTREVSKLADTSIVIDAEAGMVFANEDELYSHFLPQITAFENEFRAARKDDDIKEKDYVEYENLLEQVLDDPDEIWEDAVSIHGFEVYAYVSRYANDEESAYYVALCYVTDGTPSFVYLHFPTWSLELADRFRRGTLIYDRLVQEVAVGAIEGDALGEGDELAMGLYKAMLTLRNKKDIPEKEFQSFEAMRDETIDEPDEIWKSTDLSGNNLVTFIRDFSEDENDSGERKGIKYLVITLEDSSTSSHALLFSFPTKDGALVDRYRHGENLQAEEVVQESSH